MHVVSHVDTLLTSNPSTARVGKFAGLVIEVSTTSDQTRAVWARAGGEREAMTEQVNSRYELPRKELFQALNCLAISTAPIQMRLTAAAKHLRTLFAHDFPVGQRSRFAALIKRLLEDPANEDLPRNGL